MSKSSDMFIKVRNLLMRGFDAAKIAQELNVPVYFVRFVEEECEE